MYMPAHLLSQRDLTSLRDQMTGQLGALPKQRQRLGARQRWHRHQPANDLTRRA
jgi:hypothetical protein